MVQQQSELAEKQSKSDSLINEAQRQLAYLREQNPILDRQEEELKARRVSMQDDLEQLNAELKGLSWFPIGWLTNFFKRRHLGQERARLEDNIQAVDNGIRKVRETWQAEKTRLQQAQTDLQAQWQTLSVDVSQLQARVDYLSANFDRESKRNAAWNLLGNMREVPVREGAWEERLSPLTALNRSKTDYETGLRSVAEILGMLKGLTEGMDRFIRSVATVYEEQRRYKLPTLTVKLPKTVTAFHAIWPEFQARVKDEKFLGTHPIEFEQRIHEFLPERLGEASIQQMFEDAGNALTRATKSWR
jgi:hypothetical protein